MHRCSPRRCPGPTTLPLPHSSTVSHRQPLLCLSPVRSHHTQTHMLHNSRQHQPPHQRAATPATRMLRARPLQQRSHTAHHSLVIVREPSAAAAVVVLVKRVRSRSHRLAVQRPSSAQTAARPATCALHAGRGAGTAVGTTPATAVRQGRRPAECLVVLDERPRSHACKTGRVVLTLFFLSHSLTHSLFLSHSHTLSSSLTHSLSPSHSHSHSLPLSSIFLFSVSTRVQK
jgi:hypothetical protein